MILMSMGVGMTIYISEDVISGASIDLDSISDNSGEIQHMNQKKQEISITNLGNQSQIIKPRKNNIPVSVKYAALEALETLLTVGGAMRSERSNVDRLLITVATDVCKGGWKKVTKHANYGYTLPGSPTWADFQLASLRALLASLLSRGRIRPPYLAQGLELFRGGI